MKKLFSLIAITSMFALTACGGGGGSDSGGNGNGGTALPFSVTASTVAGIDEGQSVTFTLTPSNAKGQVTTNVTVSNAGSAVTVTKVNETTYTITPVEVDRDLNATIRWTALDGTSTATQKSGSTSFSIKNTSFDQALAEIEVFSANKDRVTGFTEEKLLLTALREIAAVLGENAANVSSTSIEPQDAKAFSDQFDALIKKVTNYKAGQAGDAELSAEYTKAKADFETLASPYKSQLNALLAALAKDGKAQVQVSTFFINTELDTVSMLFGNTELGSVQGGRWIFNENVAYVNDLVENAGCAL